MKANTDPHKKKPGDDQDAAAEIQAGEYPDYQESNIAEGGEFLDDAIRTEEEPPEETITMQND